MTVDWEITLGKPKRYGMWIWPEDLYTKTSIDSIIAYCAGGNRITDLYACAQDYNVNPATSMGDTTLMRITAYRPNGVYPFTYLLQQANAIGVRVHAWFIIYPWFSWGGSSSMLLTQPVHNAENHDNPWVITFASAPTTVTMDGANLTTDVVDESVARISSTIYQVKSGSATGGTFTLTVDGSTTAAIAYNATTATVVTALSNIGKTATVAKGDTINFASSTMRGVVTDALADFASENTGLYGVNLDYIRTDGTVQDITADNITTFVGETRTKLAAGIELSCCTLGLGGIDVSHKQDVATWLNNNYVSTVITMGYGTAFGEKKVYWDTCNFGGKRLVVGHSAGDNIVNPSDFRANLIRYRDRGYWSLNIFNYAHLIENSDFAAALDAYRRGTIDSLTTMGAITKITVTPADSFALTIGGTEYTTTYASVTDHTTTDTLKAHVEGIEGQRPFVYYYRPTTTTVLIAVGEFQP